MYEIQSKSDFQTGAALVVKVLEDELDQKALYTILADKPDFILPFHHRAVDGQIEFTYQIGNRSKLTYLSGERSPREYSDLWQSILQPIMDCGDWFMAPYSLLFRPDHLYYDKADRTISYIYIPSVRPCSDYNALKRMVMEVAKLNHVTDINLENKVIWAIQDFNPNEFLKIVKPAGTREAQGRASGNQADFMRQSAQPVQQFAQMNADQMQENNQYAQQPGQYEYQFAQSVQQSAPSVQYMQHVQQPGQPVQYAAKQKKGHKPDMSGMPAGANGRYGDIAINLPADGKAQKVKKTGGGLFGLSKQKTEKPKQKPKGNGGIFGKKKKPQQEIMQGAAAMPRRETSAPVQPGFPGNAQQANMQPASYVQAQQTNMQPASYVQAQQANMQPASYVQAPQANMQPASYVQAQQASMQPASYVQTPQANRPPEPQFQAPSQANIPHRTEDDVTVLDVTYENNGPRFRYAGNGEHPRVIMVDIAADGGVFTIGRFDASVGSRQSNFEFDKKVKAISRRHAAVERKAEVYCIVDLSSSAGTFVNGRRLPPNTSIVLKNGCRVSFGNAGAEYIWEE